MENIQALTAVAYDDFLLLAYISNSKLIHMWNQNLRRYYKL